MAKKAAAPAATSKNASKQAGETYIYKPVPAEKAAQEFSKAMNIPTNDVIAVAYSRNTVVINKVSRIEGNVLKQKKGVKRMMPGNSIWLSYPGSTDDSAFFADGSIALIDRWADDTMTHLVIGYSRN